MERVIKVLIFLSKDKGLNTSSDAQSLLGSVCNFNFILSRCILKFILSNTNALSKCLQGEIDGLCKAVEKSYSLIMYGKKAQMISNNNKTCIEEGSPKIEYKYAHVPRGSHLLNFRHLSAI